MKYNFFILFIINLLCLQTSAQHSIQGILKSVADDERMGIASTFVNASKSAEFRLPYVESVDFRTDWDRMMPSRQKYRIRANFNGFLQNNAEIKRYNSLVNLKTIKLLKEQKDFLTQKYIQILEAIDADQNKAICDELLSHFLNLDNIYRKAMAMGSEVSVSDFLKNKENILNIHNKRNSFIQKRAFRYECLKLDTIKHIETNNLITPQQMRAHLVLLDFRPNQNLENKQLAAELDFINAKVRLKKAENSKLVDYVQVGYTVREDLIGENKFSVALGLTLPYKGTTRVALKELALNKSELIAQTAIRTLKLEDEFTQLMEEFKLNYANLQVIDSLYNSQDYKRLKEQIRRSGHISPFEAEELKKSEIEVKLRRWESYFELLTCYVKLLDLNDLLAETPLRNYLSDAEPFL